MIQFLKSLLVHQDRIPLFKGIDQMVRRSCKEVFPQIDDNQCFNCCRETRPVSDQKDLKTPSMGCGVSAVPI
ncbi:MAG: hypothetical protein SWE60_01150 [Thermodesulfobacteriota bacterium]|nr:hypothetical protein [Thermodesulfobacteriota bacterium]